MLDEFRKGLKDRVVAWKEGYKTVSMVQGKMAESRIAVVKLGH
jgi:hypothetical protein